MIVRLDDFRSDRAHGAAIGGSRAHAFGRSERRHYRASHAALNAEQLHTAFASEALARKRLAFKASSWTSSKEGMLSSHSRSVAVWPTRSIARSYNFQTGSITGWSCVSRIYFLYFEWPAMWIWATRSAGTLLT